MGDVLITNHVAQGAVVGALAPGPVSAFVLGVASHLTADSVPHWGAVEYDDFLRVAVPDGLIGLTLLGWLARRTPSRRRATVVAGMLGACFPDADKPGRHFFGRSPFPAAVDDWHARIQREAADRMPFEILGAVATTALATVLIERRGGRLSRRGG